MKKLFSFSGSVSCAEFRRFGLAALGSVFAVNVLGYFLMKSPPEYLAVVTALKGIAFTVVGFLFAWSMLAMSVKRCRGMQISAAFCLLYLFPIAQLLFFAFLLIAEPEVSG